MLSFVRFRVNQLRHVLGTGRALENARRDRDESERALAALAVLEGRYAQANAA
jgi:hypothetical protein